MAIFYIHFDEKRERKGMCPAVLVKRQFFFHEQLWDKRKSERVKGNHERTRKGFFVFLF